MILITAYDLLTDELSSSMTSPIIPMLLLTGSMGSGRHLLVKILAKYNGKFPPVLYFLHHTFMIRNIKLMISFSRYELYAS